MKKSLFIIIVLLVVFAFVILGVYKFNSLICESDNDFDVNSIIINRPITYNTTTGEVMEALFLNENTVKVRFIEVDKKYFKDFTAFRVPSTSGVKYITQDNRFTFWTNNKEASITSGSSVLFFYSRDQYGK